MEVTYTDNSYLDKMSVTKSLRDLALESCAKNEPRKTPQIAEKSIEFTEALVDILYKKGVLNDTDIKEIARKISILNLDNLHVTPY